ncbi:MAG: 50S ribosomal protein L25 [Planctomycetia bacterium]
MAETFVINAKPRTDIGTTKSRRLRRDGRIPAIIYGHKETPVALSLDVVEIQTMIRKDQGHGLVELHVDGAPTSCVIKDVQFDVFGREILHVDFERVSKGDKVILDVPVVIKGTAVGVTSEGGMLDHLLHSVALLCPAESIMDHVTVNVSNLKLNHSILVKDLELKPGVVPKIDGELIVVHVVAPAGTSDEAANEGPAEPELIRREEKPKDE